MTTQEVHSNDIPLLKELKGRPDKIRERVRGSLNLIEADLNKIGETRNGSISIVTSIKDYSNQSKKIINVVYKDGVTFKEKGLEEKLRPIATRARILDKDNKVIQSRHAYTDEDSQGNLYTVVLSEENVEDTSRQNKQTLPGKISIFSGALKPQN